MSDRFDSTSLGILWRRKWIVIITFVVVTGVAAVVSKSLPKVYATSATLLVSQPQDAQTFDAVQASQVLARTYSDLLKSPNVARDVGAQVGSSRGTIEGAVSIDPVPETQLVKITAEDRSAARAQQIANAYADVFIARSRTRLAQTTKTTVTLADPAARPDGPARPKPTLYTLLAAILGLALGCGLAFLRDRLDSRLRGFEDVESTFGVAILTSVPRRGRSEASVVAFTEAFRLLRTNLQFATPEGMPRTIAVTSGSESEGKTTTTGQLAIAAGTAGTRVIAVEADLHRPDLQRFFLPEGSEPLRPGLSNYLVGGSTSADIIHTTTVPTVDFVPAGPAALSLAQLLESDRGSNLVDDLSAGAQLTIFDCPPLGLGADAAAVAARVDGVILVVNMENTSKDSVRRSLRQIEAVRATLLGVVLNRDPTHEPEVYGYYGSSQGSLVRT